MNRERGNRILSALLAVAVVAAVLCAALPPAPAKGQGGYTWTEVTPPVTGNYLFGVCSIAEDDVWAVGDGGTIVHYDGSGWSTVSSPTTYTLHSISPAYKEYIWAVGTSGTIIRYSGSGGWNSVSPSPATELLYDVSTLASGEAWAVGIEGGIFHCTSAGSWSEVLPKPTGRPLRGVAAISWNDVWAVGEGGAYPGSEYATVLHYDGVSWSEYPTTAYGYMLEISAVAANDVWGCGSDGGANALLFHYDGSGWTSYPVEGCTQLWGIQARASDDVWAVGQGGKVMHFDGSTWADVSGATDSTLYDVVAPAPGVVWAVGASGLILKGVAATPTITSLSRTTGPIGAEVTISGEHFGGARSDSTVKFNGKAAAAADYLDWSDVVVRVKVPGGTTSGPVTVTTDFGTSNGILFGVTPTITSITPSSGTSGTTVSIANLAGTGFAATPTVRLKRDGQADIVATGVIQVSSSRLTCEFAIPSSAPTGTWDLLIQNPDGQSAIKTAAFTINSPSSTWYLAEGTTAWGFGCYISVTNPNASAVHASITYMTGTGNVSGGTITLPAKSQTTMNPAETLGNKDFSTKVICTEGKTIAVDRTMEWTGEGAASPEGHTSVGVTAPAKTWYLPEGCSAFGFETWLLIQNPNGSQANCTATYMIEGEAPKTVAHDVPANTRKTFNMADDIGQKNASIKVVSNIPVIPERAMYRNNKREGHDSIGTTTSANDYYMAEGTTAWGFTTWVLIQNPASAPSDVTITYMTPSGKKTQPSFSLPGNSRKTIKVNDVAGMGNTDFSTQVHGSKPIIAERSMYWDNGTGEACHDSIGMSSAHTTFYLPDGQTSGGYETWTLVQNPNGTAVTVEVSYLKAGGGAVSLTKSIPANSRQTFNMADKVPSGRASIMVTSKTSGKKIMVERAMYWNNRGAGTDTIGGFSD